MITKTLQQSKILLLMVLCILAGYSSNGQFAKGADVSWVSEMESSGYQWYNDNGSSQDIYQILKDHGMNAIRLRVWVNPSNGWSNQSDMLYLASRASSAGMDIMLTIHYSDSWADPGQQNKPSSWSSYSTQELYTQVYNYTYDMISTMQSNGVTPKWVQIGNETNDGMLWENGRASANMQTYAWLVNSGHNAVKDVNGSILTIVHLSNAYDNALYQWNIGGIISNGANFDIIGMSLYPEPGDWSSLSAQAYSNMQDMRSRYGKEVMICEIGMRQDEPQATHDFVADILAKTRSAGGLGVFYWEPQVYNGWKSYGKGAWQENGRPSIAMDAFLEGGGSSCDPSNITPYLQVDGGSWQQASNVTITAGSSVKFGPQPASGGSWSWSGCGTSGSAREQTVSPTSTCTATATYTNSCGAQSTQAFNITVEGNSGGTPSGDYVQLQNRGTGLLLDGMGLTNNGATCGQYAGTNHINSHWEMSDTGDGYVQFINRGTGLILDGMGRTSNGSDCGQWGNTTHPNSNWSVQQYDGSYYRIQNRTSGLYLDGMGRTNNGANVGQWGNTTHPNAQWQIITVSGARAISQDSGEVLAENEGVRLFPNPIVDNTLYIKGLKSESLVRLTNLSGQLIFEQKVSADTSAIRLDQSPGVYILSLESQEGRVSRQVVIR